MSASSSAEPVAVDVRTEGWSSVTRGAFRFSRVFDGPRMASIQLATDERRRFLVEMKKNAFTLKGRQSPVPSLFTYQRPNPRTLVVDGTMDGKRIHATLRLEEREEFVLTSRGFHWINEVPYNR